MYNKKWSYWFRGNETTYIIIAAWILLILTRLMMGFTDPAGATKVLNDQGYSEVEITGWRPFMGSDSDVRCTGFKAKSPNGTAVTGAVTGGVFKGKVIRLD
jgi:hypothetical protein